MFWNYGKVLNWCPWKTSVLASGSGHPKPSICLQSRAPSTTPPSSIRYHPICVLTLIELPLRRYGDGDGAESRRVRRRGDGHPVQSPSAANGHVAQHQRAHLPPRYGNHSNHSTPIFFLPLKNKSTTKHGTKRPTTVVSHDSATDLCERKTKCVLHSIALLVPPPKGNTLR